MNYLIGYDISEPKRLQKVHKLMTKYATPVQYSIFLFEGTKMELKECISSVLKFFNKKEDDLRIYPLPTDSNQWQIGKTVLPEGIIWSELSLGLS